MDKLLEWLANNKELIMAVIGLVVFVLRNGYQELAKKLFAVLVSIAKEALTSVTKEEVAGVALLFYDKLPDLIKLFISEAVWVEFWWARWQDFIAAIGDDVENARRLLA